MRVKGKGSGGRGGAAGGGSQNKQLSPRNSRLMMELFVVQGLTPGVLFILINPYNQSLCAVCRSRRAKRLVMAARCLTNAVQKREIKAM